jgi:hypothetical protein
MQLRSRQCSGESGVHFMRRCRGQTSGARRASHFTVARDALLARLASPDGKALGDISAATEVHLVGCLAVEGAVGDSLVVLGHVELDEPLDGREVVERVQEQPAMFERPPPGLDEGVGEADVDRSDDAPQSACPGSRAHPRKGRPAQSSCPPAVVVMEPVRNRGRNDRPAPLRGGRPEWRALQETALPPRPVPSGRRERSRRYRLRGEPRCAPRRGGPAPPGTSPSWRPRSPQRPRRARL